MHTFYWFWWLVGEAVFMYAGPLNPPFCEMYQWKLYLFHTFSIHFDIPNTHWKVNILTFKLLWPRRTFNKLSVSYYRNFKTHVPSNSLQPCMSFIPYALVFGVHWTPMEVEVWFIFYSSMMVNESTLSTCFMTLVDLTPLFVCTRFHTTLAFQTPLLTRKFGRAGYSTFSSSRQPEFVHLSCM